MYLQKPKTTFIINRRLRYNSKNIAYSFKYFNCKKVYSGCTHALNNRISLLKSNIRLPENKEFYPSKHFYKCNKENFKIMSIYKTDDYLLLQIKIN